MIRFHRQRCARRWRANACTKSPSSVTIMSKLWWTVRRYELPALHIDTLSNVRAPSSRLLSTSRGSRVYVSFRTNISPEIYSCVRLANIKYLVNVFVTATTTGLSWGFVCTRLQHMYILEAAEQAGVDLPATCRGGICGYVFEPSPSSVSVSENVRTW